MSATVIMATAAALAGLFAGSSVGITVFAGKKKNNDAKAEKERVITPQKVTPHPAERLSVKEKPAADVLTVSMHPDAEKIHSELCDMKLSGNADPERMLSLVSEQGSLSRYLKYKDSISIKIGDTVYGAYTEEGASPLGGGAGYERIVTSGDHTVTSYAGLKSACEKAKSGEVIFIPSGTLIDLTCEEKKGGYYIELPSGVTLASDRGRVKEDGNVSTGAMIRGWGGGKAIANGFVICGEDVRITGLTFEGPDPWRHVPHHTRSFYGEDKRGLDYYFTLPMSSGIYFPKKGCELDNCEISGFCNTALLTAGEDTHVHHNYIHHNQIKGLGYGVYVGHGGGVIEYNLFNYNRHSIASAGYEDSWYIARYNVDMGEILDHVYDLHGGADRKDGTKISGKFAEMYNNTFLPDDRPYHVRGIPVEYQKFYHNVLINPKEKYDFSILRGERVEIYDNIFGIEDKTVVE